MAVILSYLLSTIALESVSCNQWVFKLTTGTVYYSLCIVFVGGNILERDGFDCYSSMIYLCEFMSQHSLLCTCR